MDLDGNSTTDSKSLFGSGLKTDSNHEVEFMKHSKRYSIDKSSPFKSKKTLKTSVSKGELSTNSSKRIIHTARNFNRGNQTMESSKLLARESINHLNSPKG